MKPVCFYSLLHFMLLSAIILLFTGCPRAVGKCTYGERPAETGRVTIKSIEKLSDGGKFHYNVKVEGFFKRGFIIEEEEFNKCFKPAGYRVGSELQGSILSGGPCPPVYKLNICQGR